MKIYICLKQVPDTETRVKLVDGGSTYDTASIKWVINPHDEYAIEEAIKFKEANPSAQVTAISVGPQSRINNALLTALAMGADDSILIHTDKNIDSLTTARLIAAAINKAGKPHLIYTGKQSIDQNMSATGQMLAELLEIPHGSVISKIDYSPNKITVEREVEGGKKEIYEITLPALIATNKGLNKPRFASLPGIMKAKKKPMEIVEATTLGVDLGQQTVSFKNYSLPKERPPCKMITGDPKQQSAELARLLREESKVL